MVHEIHLAVIVAAITVIIPLVFVASSMNPLAGDAQAVLQSANPGSSPGPAAMSGSQNPMETLKQVYNNQAFAEIARCAGSGSGEQAMCEDTMGLLISTCDDSALERIDACDDPRLLAYRNKAYSG